MDDWGLSVIMNFTIYIAIKKRDNMDLNFELILHLDNTIADNELENCQHLIVTASGVCPLPIPAARERTFKDCLMRSSLSFH